MSTFQVAFTLVMLLTPAIFMLFYRPRSGTDIDHGRVRKLTRLLWGWTAVALGVYGALLALRASGVTEGWDLPRWMTFGKQPDELAWFMFFPLWFCLAMRLLAAVRPESASPYAHASGGKPTRRSASPRTRAHESPIAARHWAVGWVILAAAAVIVLWMGTDKRALAVLSLALAALPLLVTPWGIRIALREPEPMDARGSDELVRAYARHRTAKAWGFYLMAVTMVSLVSAGAVMLATGGTAGPTEGVVGGVLGSVVGIAGAAFGVTMGNQRMRIRRLLDKLESERS